MFLGIGLTVIFLAAASDEPTGAARRLAPLAFGVLLTMPGILAMLGRRRPALYLAAGVLGIPLMFVSFSGVAFPLLVPAVMSLTAYAKRSGDSVPRLAAPVIAMLAFVLGIASFFVLFVHEDPECRVIENGITCSSDVVTSLEALASLAVSAFAVVLLWTLARPRPDA